MMKMAKEAELANYRQQDESEKVQWKKFDFMNDTAVTLTNNKRYAKVDKYKVLLTKEDSNDFTESIEYKEKLIDYDKDYKSYDSYQDWNRSETFY